MHLRFGPAGTPIQCDKKGTYEGLKCAHSLGLDAYEMEFVHGVKMGETLAHSISELSRQLDFSLSSHAPYYINLATTDDAKAERSKDHIILSAKITGIAGGRITVVHPGYYMNLSKEEAYKLVRKRLLEVEEVLSRLKIKTLIGIETMGKFSSFGKLEEVLSLSAEIKQVFPVIDFAHLRALNISKFNKKEDFVKIFELVEKELGINSVKNFHVHFSEIEFTEKGEKNHLPLGTKYEPDYRAFIDACIENGYSGTVICESPKIDIDAQLMKSYYEERI